MEPVPVEPAHDGARMHPYHANVGPFYDQLGAARWLCDVTSSELELRRGRHEVLAMQALDGTWLYPAWQFTSNGHVHAELLPALRALAGLDAWLAGVWLVSAHPALNGETPRTALSRGVDPAWIATLAQQDSTTLAS